VHGFVRDKNSNALSYNLSISCLFNQVTTRFCQLVKYGSKSDCAG
jgi:hypothetical protein